MVSAHVLERRERARMDVSAQGRLLWSLVVAGALAASLGACRAEEEPAEAAEARRATQRGLLGSKKELVVPGRGFGLAGYFRLAYCFPDEVIKGSVPGFEEAFKETA